jgi:S1-C subfamily serine protease
VHLLSAGAPIAHPPRGDLLDLLLLVLAIGYGYAGWRRGLVAGALSFGGFLAGAAIGATIAPAIARAVVGGPGRGAGAETALGQRLLALVIVVVCAVLAESAGALVGLRVRAALSATPAAPVDSLGGAALDVAGLLVVCWLFGSLLATSPFPTVAREVRRSLILHAVDAVMPSSVWRLFADLDRLLQRHDLPPLTSPFGGFPVPPPGLPAPDPGVVPPVIRSAGPDVVKVTGIAPSCDRASEGSGFVYAPDHVMTNAHVVAGVRSLEVTLPGPGGRTIAARVVLYDPNRDVAVLDVPGLGRRPLRFAGPVPVGASAVVAGYPENGPLTALPARVAGEQEVTGPNIYNSRTVTRDIYTLRATVRPGNSGGPLLSPTGRVDGVVFAAAVDRPDVGYALTSREVATDAQRGATATASTSTQGCD